MHGQKGPASASYALAVYLFAPLAIIVPLTVSSAVGAHTIVGERERGSGEFLAHSPATERQIYLGKLMASLIPGYFTAAMGFLLYSLVVNLIVGPKVGGWFFPTSNWWILMLLGPPPVHRARAGGDPRDLGPGVERGGRAAGVGARDPAVDRHRLRRVEQHVVPRDGRRARDRRPCVVQRDLRVVAHVQGRLARTSPRHGRGLTRPIWRHRCATTAHSRRQNVESPRVRELRHGVGAGGRRHPRRTGGRAGRAAGHLPRGRGPRRAVGERALAAYGVGHDTKVALFLHNCPEYMELLFALSKLRAVPANVNFRYLGDELVQLVDNADAEVLVYHRSLRDRVDAARDRMPNVRHTIEIDDDGGASEYETLIRTHGPSDRIARSGDDLLLWYTGGTTGLPKGVLWHQGTLLGYGLIAAYALQGETPRRGARRADRRRAPLARPRHSPGVAAHHTTRPCHRGAPGQHRVRSGRHHRAARTRSHRRRHHLHHHRARTAERARDRG